MITDGLLGILFGAVNWLLNLFPDADLDLAGISQAWTYLADLNFFLPIMETTAAVAAVIALGPAFAVATLAQWLLVSVIRGGGGKA